MSDIASMLSGISSSIQSCHDCGYQFAVVEIINPMVNGNLIPYPAVGMPDYCSRCGRRMGRNAVKLIEGHSDKPAKLKRFAANRRYTTQEVVDTLGYKSRDWLIEARENRALPFQEDGPRITYLGSDLLRWVKVRKSI